MRYALINSDWLSFSVLLPLAEEEQARGILLNCPDRHTLTEYPGTNLYKKRFILYNEHGEKVLTLLHSPHSKIIAANSLFVEVANKWLYCHSFDPLALLEKVHSFSWQSLSRLDLAADFNPTIKQQDVIDGLAFGSLYVGGKRSGSMFHDFTLTAAERTQRVPRCLSWGSPQTDIKWKLYNKTKEIYERAPSGVIYCTKPYIAANWRKNGLDPANVWRLEVSIMGASGYERDGVALAHQHGIDPTLYTPLFYDLYKNRFQVHLNEGHKQKRDDKLVSFLRIPPGERYRIRKCDPKNEQHHTDHANTLRCLMEQLNKPEVKAYPELAAELLQTTESVILLASLHGYFFHATGLPWQAWKSQYIDKLQT